MAGYDADKMRALLKKQMGGRSADPNEFKPPKATDGQVLKYRFYILPPVYEGDAIVGGTAGKSMDLFSVTDAQHWVDKKPYGCPRVISGEELECEMCATGFKLKNEAKSSPQNSDALQSALSRQWLPTTNRLVNIYFPPVSSNPEELRDKVMWFKGNNTLYNMWYDATMRDDAGPDEEDPLPFGMFFDENNAFLFNLVIEKDGQYNGYKKSKFIVTDKTGALASGPIVRKADGSPDAKAIQKILSRRHDLFSKIESYDVDAITKLARRLIDAADDGGFDSDETGGKARPAKPSNANKPKPMVDEDEDDDVPVTSKRTPAPKAKPAPASDEDEDDDVEVPASEVLSEESPLGDDDDDAPSLKRATAVVPKSNGKTATAPKAKPAAVAAPAPEPETSATDDDEQDPEVQALLGQLNDDD